MSAAESESAAHPAPALTPSQKLAAAERLLLAARELKAAALRAAHPTWSAWEIEAAVREIFLRGRP